MTPPEIRPGQLWRKRGKTQDAIVRVEEIEQVGMRVFVKLRNLTTGYRSSPHIDRFRKHPIMYTLEKEVSE